MKGGKPGLNVRRKGALARLEAMKKRSTSDSSLHSEDRVLQPENEKERDSGDRTFQAQEERGRNRSVKLQRAIVFIGKYTTLRSRDRGSNPLSSPRLLKFV